MKEAEESSHLHGLVHQLLFLLHVLDVLDLDQPNPVLVELFSLVLVVSFVLHLLDHLSQVVLVRLVRLSQVMLDPGGRKPLQPLYDRRHVLVVLLQRRIQMRVDSLKCPFLVVCSLSRLLNLLLRLIRILLEAILDDLRVFDVIWRCPIEPTTLFVVLPDALVSKPQWLAVVQALHRKDRVLRELYFGFFILSGLRIL